VQRNVQHTVEISGGMRANVRKKKKETRIFLK